MSSQFFLVWKENGGAPKKRHSSLMAAKLEAERLARVYVGTRFYVLASVGDVAVSDLQWTRHDLCMTENLF